MTAASRATVATGEDDDLYFNGAPLSPPGGFGIGGEPLPPSYPQSDCDITSSSGTQSVVRTYRGVHLSPQYAGTVDFQVSTFVGTLELHGGDIAQNDAFDATAGGGHLAVTTRLDWTDGDLNDGPTAGWVHIIGATGTIDPGDGNTVGLGSTLSIESGTTVTQVGGTSNS